MIQPMKADNQPARLLENFVKWVLVIWKLQSSWFVNHTSQYNTSRFSKSWKYREGAQFATVNSTFQSDTCRKSCVLELIVSIRGPSWCHMHARHSRTLLYFDLNLRLSQKPQPNNPLLRIMVVLEGQSTLSSPSPRQKNTSAGVKQSSLLDETARLWSTNPDGIIVVGGPCLPKSCQGSMAESHEEW